jgi:hypothetical protein
MNRLLLLLSLMLLCASAIAAAWQWRLLFERGIVRVSVDEATRRVDGDRLEVWLLFDYQGGRPAQNGIPAYLSSAENRLVDCAHRQSGIARQALYAQPRGAGEPVRIYYHRRPTMEPVAPGTLGDAILSSLCPT